MISVYIMSGPCGSGKTHQAHAFARVMHSEGEKGVIVSADHYWSPELSGMVGVGFNELDDERIIEALGVYNFDVKLLSVAHQMCMRSFVSALSAGRDGNYSVIVDNTNIKSYEIAPYYLVGEALGAEVEILRVGGVDVGLCLARQRHGVPAEIVEKMHAEFSEVGTHPWTDEPNHPVQHMPWWKSRVL